MQPEAQKRCITKTYFPVSVYVCFAVLYLAGLNYINLGRLRNQVTNEILEIKTDMAQIDLSSQFINQGFNWKKPIYYGKATWYGHGYYQDGTKFKGNNLTFASPSWLIPRYTWAIITNLDTGQTTIARCNDNVKDPTVLVDLSYKTAVAIGICIPEEYDKEKHWGNNMLKFKRSDKEYVDLRGTGLVKVEIITE